MKLEQKELKLSYNKPISKNDLDIDIRRYLVNSPVGRNTITTNGYFKTFKDEHQIKIKIHESNNLKAKIIHLNTIKKGNRLLANENL